MIRAERSVWSFFSIDLSRIIFTFACAITSTYMYLAYIQIDGTTFKSSNKIFREWKNDKETVNKSTINVKIQETTDNTKAK